MSDNVSPGFPFSFEEFDEDTQMSVGIISHDLISQVRDKFNKHHTVMREENTAMRMALLDVLASKLLDLSILKAQVSQLSSMYVPLAESVEAAQSAVNLVAQLTHEDPTIKMMQKMGVPSIFDIVAQLEANEATLREDLKAQEKFGEKSSDIPPVDNDKL